MSRSTLAVIALSVMLPACSASEAPVAPLPTGPSAVSPLAGTSWVLQRLGDVEVLGGAAATLAFADGGRISGSGSCNQFSGTARVDGQSLTIGPLAVTRMACAEPVMQQEQRYLDALALAQRYERRPAELLVFTTARPEPLRFTPR